MSLKKCASAELQKKPFLQIIIAGFCEIGCKSKSVGIIHKPRRTSRIARIFASSLRL